MFYILRDYCSVGGGWDIPFHDWYEYKIQIASPSLRGAYVKVNLTKEELKNLVKTYKGDLEETLAYLYNLTKANSVIDNCFEE